jgi:hypothetical protein
VVGTGNTPLDKVLAAAQRDLFYDAPIQDITNSPPAGGIEWGPEIAPLASANFADVNGVTGEVSGSFQTLLLFSKAHRS